MGILNVQWCNNLIKNPNNISQSVIDSRELIEKEIQQWNKDVKQSASSCVAMGGRTKSKKQRKSMKQRKSRKQRKTRRTRK